MKTYVVWVELPDEYARFEKEFQVEDDTSYSKITAEASKIINKAVRHGCYEKKVLYSSDDVKKEMFY